MDNSSTHPSQVQVIVKFTTGAQAVFLCQWHLHSVTDLLAAIRQHHSSTSPASPASSNAPISIPTDRVHFKLLHAGSILPPDVHPLALLKRQLLVTHSPFLAKQAILLPGSEQQTANASPPPPLLHPSELEPPALFSVDDDNEDPGKDDDAQDVADENAPLHPDRPRLTASKPASLSPRPVNERLPLLRAAPSSTPTSRPSSPPPSSPSPRASPDPPTLIETVVVLCSVSEAHEGSESPASNDSEQHQQQQGQAQAADSPRGFDALLSQGFSSADVAAFRRTFHLARGTAAASETERLRLEDAWVAGDHAADQRQVAVTEQSTVKALVKGAALGYFLGVPLVLGVKEVASVDRRVVAGAVLGLVVNFGVGVLMWINQG